MKHDYTAPKREREDSVLQVLRDSIAYS